MKLRDLRQLTLAAKDADAQDIAPLMQENLRKLGLDPDNFYQELEMSSRYVNTHRDISHAPDMSQLHSHTFYEIICCRSSLASPRTACFPCAC